MTTFPMDSLRCLLVTLICVATISPISLFMHGSEANEPESDSEAKAFFIDKVQHFASIITENVSQLCPTNQLDYLHKVSTVVAEALSDIYEEEDEGPADLEKLLYYLPLIQSVNGTLQMCMHAPDTYISYHDFFQKEYPSKIIQVVLRKRRWQYGHRNWRDLRPCIRTKERSKFYPQAVASILDTLWQSFLIGFLGCKVFWNTFDLYNYADIVQNLILLPLLKHWNSKFISVSNSSWPDEDNTSNTTLEAVVTSVFQEAWNRTAYPSSSHHLSSYLEKCNVMLFLKYPVDPLPCFRDLTLQNF